MAVINAGLAAITLVTVLLLESDRILWQRAVALVVSYVVLGMAMRQLDRYYANSFVKVFVAEEDAVIGVIRETLRRERVAYTTTVEPDRIRFLADRSRLSLIVEYFPLNLPVDMHLIPVAATKVTLTPSRDVDGEMMSRLRGDLDRRFS